MAADENPREPKNVKKLIADAKARKAENAVVRYVKRIIAQQKQQPPNGGGTRRSGR
jgi:hypothetical protein